MNNLIFPNKDVAIEFFNEIGYEIKDKDGTSYRLVIPINPPENYPGNDQNKIPSPKNYKKWYHLRRNIKNLYQDIITEYAPIGVLYEHGSFRFTVSNRSQVILNLQEGIKEAFESRFGKLEKTLV